MEEKQDTTKTMAGTPSRPLEGLWGERAEEEVDVHSTAVAMEELRILERQLSRQSQARAHPQPTNTKTSRKDLENADDASSTDTTDAGGEDFDLSEFLQSGLMEARGPDGGPTKRLGVSFKNLTVKGRESSSASVHTLPRAIFDSFGPGLWKIARDKIPILSSSEPTRTILHDMNGTVNAGEIMLVLGRPGSGCSTFLKTVANNRDEFASVEGDVFYGAIPADEQQKKYRGEVVYSEEDDRHFPSLTVWQTLWLALRTKTKKQNQWVIPQVLDSILQIFGISHVGQTLVGDEHVRGVSGGERKRVSLAETLATRASVVCWDNSTRGLDASTALNFIKSLRTYTDISGRTTLVTLYQAGESIYSLVDKVLVLDQGRMLYQGPASEAKKYFEDLGYYAPPRQTTADFLTSITDTNSRKFQEGREDGAPKTPEELERAFRESPQYQRVIQDIEAYETNNNCPDNEMVKTFESTVQGAKSKHVSAKSPYTISFPRQVYTCIQRQAWLQWHDRSTFYTKLAVILANSLVMGSLFAEIDPTSTSSTAARPGITFIAVAFIGWLQFAELMPAITGRTTLERQRIFAFYRPSAVVVARAVLDLPALLVMCIFFIIPFYFISQLDIEAGKFWIFFVFVYVGGYVLTSMFRMLAAFSKTVDDAILYVGVLMNVLFICAGYVLPRETMISQVPWFGWITFVNPVSYAFESVMLNEHRGLHLICDEEQLIPRGPGAIAGHQGCGLPGAEIDSTVVDGLSYVQSAFNFQTSHLWRNLGINIAFILAFLLVNILAIDYLRISSSNVQSTVYAKSSKEQSLEDSSRREEETEMVQLSSEKHVFAFRDIEYSVPLPSGAGQKKLLNKVSGYVKSGQMIALMGASGAGKTTLLNTLAQRQRVGDVSGAITIDGKPLDGVSLSDIGFCEQRDVHEGSSTVLEALQFSALLRQDSQTPKSEKLAYVDRLAKLLEFADLKHALVSSLTVEQRKRVTIGVELAAKPSMLLFLDEPTSGLDSQSAYSIVRFLRKLADAGQAIICTIHQPSSDLIEQFDSILALNRGGNTAYFGPLGQNGSVVNDYFAVRGFQSGANENIAEFILETASRPSIKSDGEKVDWDEEWQNSNEAREVADEVDRANGNSVGDAAKPSTEARSVKCAASPWLQSWLLTKRMFIKYWREPHYVYGRIFLHAMMGILVGFTFRDQDDSIAAIRNRTFSAIVFPFFVPPPVVNSLLSNFFGIRDLWEDRELPSATYSWFAFCSANILTEIPIAIVAGTIYFLLWYFPAQLPTEASVAGYVYFISLLWSLFMSSFGHWVSAAAPSYSILLNVLPTFFVVFALVTPLFTPWQTMPAVWKYTAYYANPTTWYMRGVLSTILPLFPIQCSENELARFSPPSGSTCGDYASEFLDQPSITGYLANPDATSNCGFCQFSSGEEYMGTLNVHLGDKWPSLGYMFAFVIGNWALFYFFTYTIRVKGWTFGFGPLATGLKKMKARVLPQKAGKARGGENAEEVV